MEELTEVQKVRTAATLHQYWTVKCLIESALEAKLFMNLNKGKKYSYERIYAMLREEKNWVTEKLVDFAEKNPRGPQKAAL